MGDMTLPGYQQGDGGRTLHISLRQINHDRTGQRIDQLAAVTLIPSNAIHTPAARDSKPIIADV
jgi:hypothetical protein